MMTAKVSIGKVASVHSGFSFKSRDWVSSGVPVIKIANVKRGWIVLEGCSYVTEEVARDAAGYELLPGDILISMTGEIGEVAKIRNEGRMLLNQRVGRFSIKDPRLLDSEFLYYSLQDPRLKQSMVNHAYGVAQANISPALIEQQEIYLPSLLGQRRIAVILSSLDDLIENDLRRIRILEETARAIYREWFVHFRFPGHEAVRKVDSPVGPIPQGWHVRQLREVAEVNRAQINPRSPPDELYYIDISSVSAGNIDETTTYTFEEAPGRARRVVAHGDVIWSCVRPNRRSHAMVLNPTQNTIASTGFAVLTARGVPYVYLYQATTTDEFVAYLTNNATGAAYPAVTATTFENADLVVPSQTLLARYDALSTPTAELIALLKRQVENLRAARDLLLPRLISGRLSLAQAEAAL